MRAACLCLTSLLLLGCAGARPTPPPAAPRPPGPLLASLRRTGLSLRPESPRPTLTFGSAAPAARPPQPPAAGAPVSAPPPGSVPAPLRRPEELRLLGGRLGRPPSLGLGCAPLGEAAVLSPATSGQRSCLGAPLGPPLEAAAVVEQVAGKAVIAVAAEESFVDPAAADARYQALLSRLRAVLGPPELRAGQLVYRIPRLRGHELTLELLPGTTSYVTLQLRRDP